MRRLAIALLFIALGCGADHRTREEIRRTLPPDATVVLQYPDYAEALLIDGPCEASGQKLLKTAMLPGSEYVIRSRNRIPPALASRAAAQVLSSESFFDDEWTCVFCPNRFVVFHRESRSVILAISPDCLQAEVSYPPASWTSGVVVLKDVDDIFHDALAARNASPTPTAGSGSSPQ